MKHEHALTRRIGKDTFTFKLIVFSAIYIFLMQGDLSYADRIMSTYNVPENSSGLAWDGNLIWIGGVGDGGDWIRSFDPVSGQISDSIEAPVQDCIGLAYVEGRLSYLSPRSDTTYFVSPEGYDVAFENPIENLGGLGVHGNSLWSATYSQPRGTLIKITENGRTLRSMPFSGRHSRDMAFHEGRLYVADRLSQEIRVVNPETGRFIKTFPTPGINPDGITSDGDFLWLLDDGDEEAGDLLYKIHVAPDGNIRFSRIYHNFGSVVIGEEPEFDIWIYNDGDRTASLSDFEFRNGNDEIFIPHMWLFPEDGIIGGDSAQFTVTFRPAYADSVGIEFSFSFDVDPETYWINFEGKGISNRRDIIVHTRILDFGSTRTGEFVRGSNLRYLEIENNGGEMLTIEELRFSNQSFFSGYFEFPLELHEPGLYRIPIFFSPNRGVDTVYHESVLVVSDDPDSPEIRVNLNGSALLQNYGGGKNLWVVDVGNRDMPVPMVRAIQDIEDVTGDGLADIVIASNNFTIEAFHAASTDSVPPIWSYYTNDNPWRNGLVSGQDGLSEGDDWDNDGVHDIVFGLEGGAKQIIALSGRTGEEIWIFDTHGLQGGGGNVFVADGGYDFNNDGIRDVSALISSDNQQNSTNGIIMIDGSDGSEIWFTQFDEKALDCITIEDFTGDGVQDFCVLLEDGAIYGVDGRRGQEVWDASVEGEVTSFFAMMGDVNADGSNDFGIVTYMSGISVFNGSNGVRIWHMEAGGYFENLNVGIPISDVNGNGRPDLLFGDIQVNRALDGLTGEAAWDTSVHIGTVTSSMAPLMDYDGDGIIDYISGTDSGRLFCESGNGVLGVWSYSNQGEGHEFVLSKGVRDLDGNGEMDVMAAMANGKVYCFAGSWIGLDVVDREEKRFAIPEMLILDPAFPNPFNSTVILPIKLSKNSGLNVNIYDLNGRQVYSDFQDFITSGRHNIVWHGNSNDGNSLPSGVYFLDVNIGSSSKTAKIQLIR